MNDFQIMVDKYIHTCKTKNFDAMCADLKKSGKTYAEYQKERYSALYDVKSHIEAYKRTAEMQRHFGYKVKYGDVFRVVGKYDIASLYPKVNHIIYADTDSLKVSKGSD